MRTSSAIRRILTAAALWTIAGNAQHVDVAKVKEFTPRLQRLHENTRRLTNQISVSRTTLLLGEMFWIRASVRNNTPGALEVFEPFRYQDESKDAYKDPFFGLLVKDLPRAKQAGLEWAPPDLFGREVSDEPFEGPAKYLVSSEVVEKEFSASDAPARSLSYALNHTGEYQIEYVHGGAAHFKVVAPVKGISPVPLELPKPVSIDEEDDNGNTTGRKELTPGYLLAFTVVDPEGKHVLCASWQVRTFPYRVDWGSKPGRLEASNIDVLQLYVRVAESVTPITSLQANVAENETLTIRWVTAAGRAHQNVVTRAQRLAGPLR